MPRKGKGNANAKPVCDHCGKIGHLKAICFLNKDNPGNKLGANKQPGTQTTQNGQTQGNRHCNNCGSKDHWAANCQKTQATTTRTSSGFVMAAPWQVSPPQLEALWCKWCNTGLHSTAGCQNTNTQVEVMIMPESKDYYCDRCGYKGHLSKNCCNPYPDQKCLFCQRSGHAFQDCVRRDEPRVREMLASLPSRQSDLLVKKEEPSLNMSNTISTFKRRREALDQSQQAANSFIANLVNATTQKETQDVVPVRPHELVHIMDGILAWEQGDDCTLWGQDLTETVKAMRMYHLSEGVNFFRIFFAIHRLEAGFTINCAHAGCRGNALIITPEFQNVNVSTRSGYPRDQPEHAVFLASSCSHSDFAFEWKRSRIEERDLTPLYLLQAAHSNPIFNQFAQLKAGISTRDLDLEYDAMLELEKQRQVLDAEQQKISEASTKLRLQELVFKRHAELLGSPMDWKAPTPITNKFLPPSSPFSPRGKRAWGDVVMADPPVPGHYRRPTLEDQRSPKRARYEDTRPAQQYPESTRQSSDNALQNTQQPDVPRNDRSNDTGQNDRQQGGKRQDGNDRHGGNQQGKNGNQGKKQQGKKGNKGGKQQQNQDDSFYVSPHYQGNNPKAGFKPREAKDGNDRGGQNGTQGNHNGGSGGGSGGGDASGPPPASPDGSIL